MLAAIDGGDAERLSLSSLALRNSVLETNQNIGRRKSTDTTRNGTAAHNPAHRAADRTESVHTRRLHPLQSQHSRSFDKLRLEPLPRGRSPSRARCRVQPSGMPVLDMLTLELVNGAARWLIPRRLEWHKNTSNLRRTVVMGRSV